ncbi:MAG: trypsin-like serine peptidase, partial [Caulobacterales bacterium]|uniref:trypsin-like serine peptidase n=1 Tax=Glycocaulis sp. TaxID=1969725 RepID=UPI003F9F12A2
DELGFGGVLDIVADRGDRATREARIWQAGYSWDTGDNLSGNEDCRILVAYPDDTISHDCDTTRGDSGSPFMVFENGEWQIIATDSNFRSNPDGPFIYISSRSSRWVHLLDDFAAGRIGAGGVRPQGPGKPGAPVAIKLED